MSNDWEARSRSNRASVSGNNQGPDSSETLGTRLQAILIAIPVFEFSLYAGLAVACTSPNLAAHVWISLPALFHTVYCGLALLIAAVTGMGGLTSLLGHLFNTHFRGDANPRLTVGLWTALVVVTGIAYWLSDAT